jgi:hypothetical protein
LDAVRQVIKVVIFVASAPDFTAQPRWAMVQSQLLVEDLRRIRAACSGAVGVRRCRSTRRWNRVDRSRQGRADSAVAI